MRRRGTTALAAAVLVAAGGAGAAASASPVGGSDAGCALSCAGSDAGGGGWSAGASSVTVTVRGATGGDGGSGGTFTVPGPPPTCWYERSSTVEETEPVDFSFDHQMEDYGVTWQEFGFDPETKLPLGHAENAAAGGAYYWPNCRSGVDNRENFLAFIADNPVTFVPTGAAPPPPAPPTAEALLEIAERHLVPPEPEVEVNPAAQSLVNLPTWVWVDEVTFEEIGVRAQAGPNWADITARPGGMSLRATHGAEVSPGGCDDGGTPWGAGAEESDCAVVFERASTSSGTWPLRVETTWEATATTSAAPAPAPLEAQTAGTTVDVAVAEVQTLVGR